MDRIMILVYTLMTANLWHKAHAQINPMFSTVLGNGNGYSYFTVPQNPPTFLNPVGGGAGFFQGAASGHAHDYAANPSYKYGYKVADHHKGDFHSQQETRDGNNVMGQYSLQEPNGNVRTVNYIANSNGFQAQVQNTAG